MSWNKEKSNYQTKLNQKMNQQQLQQQDVDFAYKRYALEYVSNLLVQKKVELTTVDDILNETEKVHKFLLPKQSIVKTL